MKNDTNGAKVRLLWRLTWGDFFAIAIIAGCTIAAYMLVQFFFTGLFDKWGWVWQEPIETPALTDAGEYVKTVITYCAIIPFFEEIFFRLILCFSAVYVFERFVLKRDCRALRVFAVIASALLFALYHRSFGQLVYQFIMGLIFASAFLKTYNFLFPVFLHFINNFFVITYTYIAGGDEVNLVWNGYTAITAIVLCLTGTCIIISFVRNLKRRTDGNQKA